MKGQMSLFAKILFVVAASTVFVLVLMYINSFRRSTIEEREGSDFKMGTMNVLQKLVNDKNCLAFEINGTPQKGIIDINKLNLFVSKYNGIEPECAKALGFDYKIEIRQFPKNFTLYPGEKSKKVEVMMEYLCSDPDYGDDFILISCNYDPKTCPGICDACGEFDECNIPDCPSSCGKEPLKNCPYTGSCDVTSCPIGSPPNGICCRYLRCPKDACDYVINARAPGHSICWTAYGDCNLSRCEDVTCTRGTSSWDHGHCARGTIEIPQPVGEMVNVSIPVKTWGFGVGFGTSSFSPEKARFRELQLSLPTTIRYNDTFSTEGIIYIYAVKGELEDLYSLVEDVCEKAKVNPDQEIIFSKKMHFSFPIYYSGNELCMLDSCKIFECPYPINFENITEEGDYMIRFFYEPSTKEIKVMK